MSSEHQPNVNFHPNMAGAMGNFGGDPFADSTLGAGDDQWEMNFNTGNSSFYGGHSAPNLTTMSFVDISRGPLEDILDPSEDKGGNLGFDQYQDPGNLRYDDTQQ